MKHTPMSDVHKTIVATSAKLGLPGGTGSVMNPTTSPKPTAWVPNMATSPSVEYSSDVSATCSVGTGGKKTKSEVALETASQPPNPTTSMGKNPIFVSIDAGRERQVYKTSNLGNPTTLHTSKASGSSNDTTKLSGGRENPSLHSMLREHLDPSLLPSTNPSSPGGWEKVERENPALTDDEGGGFSRVLQALKEGYETGIWIRYGVLSTRHQADLIHAADKNIQTIVDVSGQGLTEDEYMDLYTTVLESLARAYHDWKKTSCPNTPELKNEPMATPVPKGEADHVNMCT